MRRRPFVGVLFCAVVGCVFLAARQKTAEVATHGVETKVRGHGLNPLEASVKEQLETIRGIEKRLDSIEEVARRGGRTGDGVLAPTTVTPIPHRPSARALPMPAKVVQPYGDNVKPVTADAHVFYYPWYGTPKIDGKWVHWNHVRMPHWNKQTAAKYRQDVSKQTRNGSNPAARPQSLDSHSWSAHVHVRCLQCTNFWQHAVLLIVATVLVLVLVLMCTPCTRLNNTVHSIDRHMCRRMILGRRIILR